MPSLVASAPMFVRSAACVVLTFSSLVLAQAAGPAQDPAQTQYPAPQAAQAAAAQTTDASSPPVSSLVQPATTQLAQAMPLLHPDKWKLSSELRRRSDDNLTSISNDLSSTLPNLVAAADTPQATLASLFALSRNLRALYDVVLRVATTAEIAAPEQQASALTQSLATLATARQQLDARLDATAAAQQQQISTLQTSLGAANQSLAQAKAAAQAQPTPAASTHTRPRARRKPPTAADPNATPPSP